MVSYTVSSAMRFLGGILQHFSVGMAHLGVFTFAVTSHLVPLLSSHLVSLLLQESTILKFVLLNHF